MKHVLVFSYSNSEKLSRLRRILGLKPGLKQTEEFQKFARRYPPKNWRTKVFQVIGEHLSCSNPHLFDFRMFNLVVCMEETLGLNDFGRVIDGCRAFEKDVMPERPIRNGNIIFGISDRIRILGDELEGMYHAHRPTTSTAA